MINGRSGVNNAPSSRQRAQHPGSGSTIPLDPLGRYLFALSQAGWLQPPDLVSPQLAQAAQHQSLHHTQQTLALLHRQIQSHLVENLYGSRLAFASFHREVQRMLWLANRAHLPLETGAIPSPWGQGQQLGDEEIASVLGEALQADPIIGLSDIDVAVKDRVVTLRGIVPNAFTKRAVEMLAWQFSGVADVRNDIDIRRRSRRATIGRTVRERVSR